MQIIRDLVAAYAITDLELRQLIEKTIHDLSEDEPYDPEELGYFVIVEPGDTLEMIDVQLGFSIMSNRYSGDRFGSSGFTPCFELVEEHAGYYEMVFVISDDGYGVEVFIPKTGEIDPELLAMCKQYAVPVKAGSAT